MLRGVVERAHWFFSYACYGNLLCFECFTAEQYVDGSFLCIHIIIDFLTCAHSKLATGLSCLCFTLKEVVSVYEFIRFLWPYFLACVPTIRAA